MGEVDLPAVNLLDCWPQFVLRLGEGADCQEVEEALTAVNYWVAGDCLVEVHHLPEEEVEKVYQ